LAADELLARSERQEALRQALKGLSERSAEMVTLHYFEGLDQSSIAEILGTSRGTVAVTLFRARRKLERALEHLRETER
jgi:RNA polymerase sigma factor (sigma-70 family)